jgi:hypothetical protein
VYRAASSRRGTRSSSESANVERAGGLAIDRVELGDEHRPSLARDFVDVRRHVLHGPHQSA